MSIENLFTFKNKDTILDIYSPGFPLGFSSPVFRKGVLFFHDIDEEAVADMETLPGDSGAPVYSKELNKIVGIRTAKDTERNFAYIVLSNHIVNLLKEFQLCKTCKSSKSMDRSSMTNLDNFDFNLFFVFSGIYSTKDLQVGEVFKIFGNNFPNVSPSPRL